MTSTQRLEELKRAIEADAANRKHGFLTPEAARFLVLAREALPALLAELAEPIDMVLFCPKCGLQHIDAPEDALLHHGGHLPPEPGEEGWSNPPHRSHLCHGCGHIWRPSDRATNGVAAIATKGRADSEPVSPAALAEIAELRERVERAEKDRPHLLSMLSDATERLDRAKPDILGARVSLHGLTLALGAHQSLAQSALKESEHG